MPRYHFHTADGSKFRDEDGEELPDLSAAKAVAIEVLTQMLPGKANELWESKIFSVNVKDETGRLVAVLNTVATVDPVALPDVPPET
jgi:hypothetical protein